MSVWQLGKSLPLFLPTDPKGFWKGCWRRGQRFEQGSENNCEEDSAAEAKFRAGAAGRGFLHMQQLKPRAQELGFIIRGGRRAEFTLQCLLAEKFPY